MSSYITDRDGAAEKHAKEMYLGDQLRLAHIIGHQSGADWSITQSTVVREIMNAVNRAQNCLGFGGRENEEAARSWMRIAKDTYESAVASIGGGGETMRKMSNEEWNGKLEYCNKITSAVYLACDETVADDISSNVQWLIEQAKELQQFRAAWPMVREALEMGAFHHSSCASNYYEDGSMKENWNGLGEHRKSKPCLCAHYKVDLALALLDGITAEGSGE